MSRGEPPRAARPLARRGLQLLGGLLVIGLALVLVTPLPRPLFPPDYSAVVVAEDGQILRAFLNDREQWCFPPRPDRPIPPQLEMAVLYFEDRHFHHHFGLDPLALARALYQNLVAGRVVSGASTLTMQVIRLAQPRSRTYGNKAREILLAVRLELTRDKEQILRLYLDHAPYGGNTVGYQAASLRYFQKWPEQLTWGESALLAVLPNAPGMISPMARPEQLRAKRDRLLRRLRDARAIDGQTCQLALLEPMPAPAHPWKMRAPHLARLARDQSGGIPGAIRTTLDYGLQERVEDQVAQHVDLLRRQGIRNGAALLAETATGKVRAYVGSQDFFDAAAQGQVDGVRAPRSSGSLLKPFLYALSMDAGLVLPQTLMQDVPSHFGAFSPSNADEKHSGLVRAEEALVRSLNVPAVRLLRQYGVYPFYRFLEAAGLRTLFRHPDDYGLPLIIGGAEVTLWDMAALFRSVTAGGRAAPLRYLADEPAGPTSRIALISPGACHLTLEMLRQLQRPGVEYYWDQYQDNWPLAWKTGTSYGQRDAWALGVSPQWTVAVWVGNFDGEPNPNLSGARSAAPLLFDIFNGAPKQAETAWFETPEWELAQVEVCAGTGFGAGPHCPSPRPVAAPLHMQPLRLCPYHRSLFVDESETQQVCSLCWEPEARKRIQRLVFPAAVVQQLRERGRLAPSLPPHAPDCPARDENRALAILYPQRNARLHLARDFGRKGQQVVLRAAHADRDRTIYWYLDRHFLGATTSRHTRPVALQKGWHVLEVVDNRGNRDRTRFYASRTN